MESVQAFLLDGASNEPATGVKAFDAAPRCYYRSWGLYCVTERWSSTFFPIFSPCSGYSLAMSAEPSLPDHDISDDDQHLTNRKRSSRGSYTCFETLSRLIRLSLACDQCRKTKSKCERSKTDDDPCKSCLAAGTGTPLPLLSLTPTPPTEPAPQSALF